MEQRVKTHRARDFAIGFFSWFLIGSFYYLIFNPIIYYDSPYILYTFPALTIILICVLFFRNKRAAYGVITAVVINMLAVTAFYLLFWGNFGISGLTIPIPALIILALTWSLS